MEYDTQLSQQIDLLEKLREEGRRVIEEIQESDSELLQQRGPKITENVQVVSPRGEGTKGRSGPIVNYRESENGSGKWTIVGRRGRIKTNQTATADGR